MAKGEITWFKFPMYFETIIKSYSAETIKNAELATFEYARTGRVPALDADEMIVFGLLKMEVDEAKKEYRIASRKWNKGGENY